MIMQNSTVRQLNRALETSFGNIKHDMSELKVLLNAQIEQNKQLQKQLEKSTSEVATKDKLNVLKINIGEVKEDVKKIWDLEKTVKELKQPPKRAFSEYLDALNAKLIATELKLNDVNKKAATDVQLRSVVSNINSEFNKVLADVRNIEIHKDELGKKEMAIFEGRIDRKFDAAKETFLQIRKDLKSYVDKTELKNVVSDLNNEFDAVRKDLSSIQKDSKLFVKESEVKMVLGKINKEFDVVASELSAIKKQARDFVTVNQVKGLINDIGNEFDDIKAAMAKGSVKVAEKPKVIAKPATYGASMVYTDAPKKVKTSNANTFRVFGNVMITLALISFLGSVYSYYFLTEAWMNYSAISAATAFVVGIISKTIAVIKGK